jgi:hypothetical protein
VALARAEIVMRDLPDFSTMYDLGASPRRDRRRRLQEKERDKPSSKLVQKCEIATDLMFRSRPALQKLLPDLFEHWLLSMSAEDALRFLGRKPNDHYQGEATADLKRRPEGLRVKFRMKRNSIKIYDKWSTKRA